MENAICHSKSVCSYIFAIYSNILIYVRFGNRVFRQIVGKPMGTNCTPLILSLQIYFFIVMNTVYDKKDSSKQNLVVKFTYTIRYLDDI